MFINLCTCHYNKIYLSIYLSFYLPCNCEHISRVDSNYMKQMVACMRGIMALSGREERFVCFLTGNKNCFYMFCKTSACSVFWKN